MDLCKHVLRWMRTDQGIGVSCRETSRISQRALGLSVSRVHHITHDLTFFRKTFPQKCAWRDVQGNLFKCEAALDPASVLSATKPKLFDHFHKKHCQHFFWCADPFLLINLKGNKKIAAYQQICKMVDGIIALHPRNEWVGRLRISCVSMIHQPVRNILYPQSITSYHWMSVQVRST